MDKGFYLYCIRAKNDCKFSMEGIGGGEIFAIPYQDLEAVVSEVSLKEFSSEEIQKKAQEDLGWIKGKASLHEKAIEGAMEMLSLPFPLGDDPLQNKGLKTVIPMKFGTIFKTKDSLEDTLKKHYDQFKESLEKLKGKQEWSVKVYLNRKVFQEEIKKVSPVVEEKEKEIAQLPEGTAYFMQKQVDEAVSKEADKAFQNYNESFLEFYKNTQKLEPKVKF